MVVTKLRSVAAQEFQLLTKNEARLFGTTGFALLVLGIGFGLYYAQLSIEGAKHPSLSTAVQEIDEFPDFHFLYIPFIPQPMCWNTYYSRPPDSCVNSSTVAEDYELSMLLNEGLLQSWGWEDAFWGLTAVPKMTWHRVDHPPENLRNASQDKPLEPFSYAEVELPVGFIAEPFSRKVSMYLKPDAMCAIGSNFLRPASGPREFFRCADGMTVNLSSWHADDSKVVPPLPVGKDNPLKSQFSLITNLVWKERDCHLYGNSANFCPTTGRFTSMPWGGIRDSWSWARIVPFSIDTPLPRLVPQDFAWSNGLWVNRFSARFPRSATFCANNQTALQFSSQRRISVDGKEATIITAKQDFSMPFVVVVGDTNLVLNPAFGFDFEQLVTTETNFYSVAVAFSNWLSVLTTLYAVFTFLFPTSLNVRYYFKFGSWAKEAKERHVALGNKTVKTVSECENDENGSETSGSETSDEHPPSILSPEAAGDLPIQPTSTGAVEPSKDGDEIV